MKKKRFGLVGLALCLALTGCASVKSGEMSNYTPVKNDASWGMDNGKYSYAGEESANSTVDKELTDTNVITSNQKLIRRMALEYETREYEKAVREINDNILLVGGYVESSSISGKTESNPNAMGYAKFILRVPSGKTDEFVSMLQGVGTLQRKSETAEDVTLQYVSVQSHIDALTVEYDRLLEMLKLTTDMETMLLLEQRLTSVRYELSQYETQKRTYDNLVDYSTITITINEVREITVIEPVKELGYWEQLQEDFLDNLSGIGEWFAGFFHNLVVALPQLLIFGIIIVILALIVKKQWKRMLSKEKKQEPVLTEKEAEVLKKENEAPKDEKTNYYE